MSVSEVEALRRAHLLFAGTPPPAWNAPDRQGASVLNHAAGLRHYEAVARSHQEALRSAEYTDAALQGVVASAERDRLQAHEATARVVDQARADAVAVPTNPMAQREALRRRAARLRAQRSHVLSARMRARRHRSALQALRYRLRHHRAGLRLPNGRAGIAVRAALSRLGRPYVWGATGPDQFDCSGLVQWSYARAGIHLDRTTYQQINEGIAVPRSQVRPGDLVFPHAGHVQMAIGHNLVVEAPYSGASVRISPLGSSVQIRRPAF
jgi:peptidoglycan DL-endopeptidase CwlO